MLRELLNRNVLILFCCQTVFVSGTVVLITVGGIIGHDIAPDPSLATLPVALMVVGTALTTIPAAMTMQRIGRRYGFMVGAGVAFIGAFLVTRALAADSFLLFCIGTSLMGASLGFSQQFRFAAAESVSTDAVSYAVSFILLGSIAGAFAAPELIQASLRMEASDQGSQYSGAFQLAMVLYVFAVVLMVGIKSTIHLGESERQGGRSVLQLAQQPKFITAVLAGMIGQGLMTYVMTATPISMNVSVGFSIEETSSVIRAHVIAMYLPSLITPWLIGRLGLSRVMMMGIICFAITLGIGLAGHHYMHYWGSMVLLGVGWNFLFVSGTTMLTQTYEPEERFRGQAANDFAVFSASATASLLAGSVLHAYGWEWLLVTGMPALVVMLGALFWLYRSPEAVKA